MKLRKNIICILLSMAFLIIIAPKVNAANLLINFSSPTAKVGDTITATVTGKGISGKVNLSVSGNATLSENSIFVDGSKSVSVKINGEGDVKITATAEDMKETSNATSYNGATAGTIKVSSNSSSSSSNTTTKSNNANLSNLGIKPNDFKGFTPSKTSYDVTVTHDVEEVTVYATAQDKKATIKGNETKKLNVGKNALNVVATAEDGTTKTYTINVTREENKNAGNVTSSNTIETSSDNNENTQTTDLKKLSIKGHTLTPTFSPNVYEYKLDVKEDVSSLEIETEGANNNVSIDIVGNENLKDGENIITLLVYNEETKQNSTYQITVNKTSVNENEKNNTLSDAAKKANKIRSILLGIMAFIIVCIIIFIIVKHKINSSEEEMYEYDEDDKEKIDFDDEDLQINNEEEEQKSEYDVEDYYRTNKPRKKGKHF